VVFQGFLCGIAAAILFAGKAILVRLGYAQGADATSLLLWRMLISLPCFALIAWWFARRDGALATHDRIRLLVLGVLGYHIASWLDFKGLTYIDAALERVVLFLYPTVVVGIALARRQRSVDRPLIAALSATYLGIMLTWGDRIQLGQPGHVLLGTALVAASAIVFAVHLVLIEGILQRLGGTRSMAVAMVGACTTAIIHGIIAQPQALIPPPPATVSYGAALGIFATVIPVLLAAVAMQHLGAARAAVLGTVAPSLTAVLGWIFLHERLGLLGWIGISVTMVGALLLSRSRPQPVAPPVSAAPRVGTSSS
jgi:drug/metabolite transporter (DMT)-like permease